MTAVMTHALHQLTRAGPGLSGQRVTCMAQIMESELGRKTGGCDCLPPLRGLVDVASTQWPALLANKDQSIQL
jgi:hypothetical protein